MKVTPSSMARLRTAMATSLSGGSAQMPRPVIRMAPNPERLTVRSPPMSMVWTVMPDILPRRPALALVGELGGRLLVATGFHRRFSRPDAARPRPGSDGACRSPDGRATRVGGFGGVGGRGGVEGGVPQPV